MQFEQDIIYDDDDSEEQGIDVRPPDYKTSFKGIGSMNSDVLQKHFAIMILGKPDSGKTHLIYEFLANPDLYKQKFNEIIFVTPLDKVGGIELQKYPRHNKKFDLEWIHKQFQQINGKIKSKYPTPEALAEKYGEGTDPFNVLLVLDDCVADIKKHQFDPLLKAIFFNRRHVIQNGCLSVLLTSQYYVEFPRAVRSNLSGLIVFNCTPMDWKRIVTETVHGTSGIDSEVQPIIDEIFNKPKSFLYIDIQLGKIYYGFKIMVRYEDRTIFNDQASRVMLTGEFNKMNLADLERRKMRNFGISTVAQTADGYRGVGLDASGYTNAGQRQRIPTADLQLQTQPIVQKQFEQNNGKYLGDYLQDY